MGEPKNKSINLHADRKRTLILVALFLLLSMAINTLAIVVLNGKCNQLYAFFKSDYDYSFVTAKEIKTNSYYQFDAGIVFMLSKDSLTGINSEVLMQSNGEYTSSVFWNARVGLKTDEIAVSGDIAKKYHLKEGDKLYSKHIVDSTTVEYTIREILPEISRSRGVVQTAGSSEGLIILGSDAKYLDNIKHNSVVFSKEKINNLAVEGYDISEIVYRDEEVLSEIKGILPYLGLVLLLAVCLTVGTIYFLIRGVSPYYHRLISMGFKESGLKNTYYRFSGVTVFFAIVIAGALNIALFGLFGSMKVGIFVQGIIFLGEGVSVIVMLVFSYRRMWRQ